MNKEKRPYYTREFKIEAVRQTFELGKSTAQVGRELGIPIKRLYKWRDEVKKKKDEVFPGHGKSTDNYKDNELRRLQAENKKLKQERDILKKTLIFFAKDHENDSDLSENTKTSGQQN